MPDRSKSSQKPRLNDGFLTQFCESQGHTLTVVDYRDDLTGQLVKRKRCALCGITYLPQETQ